MDITVSTAPGHLACFSGRSDFRITANNSHGTGNIVAVLPRRRMLRGLRFPWDMRSSLADNLREKQQKQPVVSLRPAWRPSVPEQRRCQTACKPGSVPPLGASPGAGMAIPLGRPLPSASCDRPEQRRGGSPGTPGSPGVPAAPTWSCSRWGFPCRRRCRRRGALLPHRFTLAARPALPGQAGGVLSVALSLGSPPPGVTRHRISVEPGLSSHRHRRRAAIRPSGKVRCGCPRAACQSI